MANNPNMALQEACRNNPAMQNVMNMIQGRDPKAVFMEECKRRGVDPNVIINELM